jgi:hypothetical protein
MLAPTIDGPAPLGPRSGTYSGRHGSGNIGLHRSSSVKDAGRNRLKRTPSRLLRAGAIVCACILVFGVLGGCSPRKSATGAPATPSATYPAPYAASTKLASNLAALKQASGPIVGTVTVDAIVRPLSGLVSIKNGATRIRMLEGEPTAYISDEIVAAGERYTSPDDTTWIDRGKKATGSSLLTALASADTTVDSGIETVTGISAHKIVTPADVVDVAPALGIDTGTFDEETTTLRIWADAAGKPIGFGALMSWKVTLGGETETVAIDFDVIFAAESSADSPVEIVAPAKAWQWIEDKQEGIAFGLPATWKRTTINDSVGMTSYDDGPAAHTIAYLQASVGDETLSQATKEVVDAMTDTPGGTRSVVIGSEDASLLSAHRSKQKDYVSIAIVVHETLGYEILVMGAVGDETTTDALAQQILATVEFTR